MFENCDEGSVVIEVHANVVVAFKNYGYFT